MTRDDAYAALADMVFRGFVTTSMHVGGVSVIFKTINEKEFRLIQMASGLRSTAWYEKVFGLYYLAYSTLMVDGQLVLKDRPIKKLMKMYGKFPGRAYDRVLAEMGVLRTVASEATPFLEGFSYTPGARMAWESMGDRMPCEEPFTGISGTSCIGLNSVQENWSYINRLLDEEKRRNEEFSTAVLIASSNNPKGAKSMRAKQDAAMEEAEERRKKLAIAGHSDAEKSRVWSDDGWAVPVDTAESLVAELNRQMAGQKDRHDLFIENYLKGLSDSAAAEAAKVEERLAELRKRDVPEFQSSQRSLSPKEMEELMKRKASTQGSVLDPEEHVGIADKQKFLSKIGSRVLTGK